MYSTKCIMENSAIYDKMDCKKVLLINSTFFKKHINLMYHLNDMFLSIIEIVSLIKSNLFPPSMSPKLNILLICFGFVVFINSVTD